MLAQHRASRRDMLGDHNGVTEGLQTLARLLANTLVILDDKDRLSVPGRDGVRYRLGNFVV